MSLATSRPNILGYDLAIVDEIENLPRRSGPEEGISAEDLRAILNARTAIPNIPYAGTTLADPATQNPPFEAARGLDQYITGLRSSMRNREPIDVTNRSVGASLAESVRVSTDQPSTARRIMRDYNDELFPGPIDEYLPEIRFITPPISPFKVREVSTQKCGPFRVETSSEFYSLYLKEDLLLRISKETKEPIFINQEAWDSFWFSTKDTNPVAADPLWSILFGAVKIAIDPMLRARLGLDPDKD